MTLVDVTPLRIEARRSLVLWLVPVVAAAHIALMASDLGVWRMSWPMASAAAGAPLMFVGPVLGGLCAWEAVRRVRLLPGGSGSRGRLPLLTVHLTAAVLVVLAACVYAVVVTGTGDAPPGRLWLSYVLVALALVAECAALGFLLGSLGGPAWFAPVTALMLLLIRIVAYQGAAVGSAQSRLSRVFLHGPPYVTVSPGGTACALLEAGAVVLAAVWLPPLVRRWRRRRAGAIYPLAAGRRQAAVGAGACGLLSVVAVAAAPPMTGERDPVDPVCTPTEVEICVWPEQEAYLPELGRLARQTQEVSSQLGVGTPARVVEYGLEPDGENTFSLDGGGVWFLSSSLADAVLAEMGTDDCLPPQDASTEQVTGYYQVRDRLAVAVELMIQEQAPPAGLHDTREVDWDQVEEVAAAPVQERRQWVEEQRAELSRYSQAWCG